MEKLTENAPHEDGTVTSIKVTLSRTELETLSTLLDSLVGNRGEPGAPTSSVESMAFARFKSGARDANVLQYAAKKILRVRQLRQEQFSSTMFGEPAWDILLVLYVLRTSGNRCSIAELAELAGTSPAGAFRWIGYLEQEHLVTKTEHPADANLNFVDLTEEGRNALDAFLARVADSAL